MLHEKPTITFNKVYLAIKFANNRTSKLIGLKIYEINSIEANKITKQNERKKKKMYHQTFLRC